MKIQILNKIFNENQTTKIYSDNLSEREKEYEDYLSVLKEKSINAIHISEKNDDLKFIGVYRDDYPKIHMVEIYEDINKKVYRLDKK